jgi:hypothetical protein
MQDKVSVGISTVIGYLGALLAIIPTVVKTLEEGNVAYHGPEKWLAVYAVVSAAVTTIGRQIQAATKRRSS